MFVTFVPTVIAPGVFHPPFLIASFSLLRQRKKEDSRKISVRSRNWREKLEGLLTRGETDNTRKTTADLSIVHTQPLTHKLVVFPLVCLCMHCIHNVLHVFTEESRIVHLCEHTWSVTAVRIIAWVMRESPYISRSALERFFTEIPKTSSWLNLCMCTHRKEVFGQCHSFDTSFCFYTHPQWI